MSSDQLVMKHVQNATKKNCSTSFLPCSSSRLGDNNAVNEFQVLPYFTTTKVVIMRPQFCAITQQCLKETHLNCSKERK